MEEQHRVKRGGERLGGCWRGPRREVAARGQGAEGLGQARNRRVALEIAEQLDFDRPLRQDRGPDGPEPLGRGRRNLRRSGCLEHRILAALVKFEIAPDQPLRAGRKAFVIDLGRRLRAQHRIGIPPRGRELGRHQIELIVEVGGAGIGREAEAAVIDLEVEAHLAPGHQLVELFLAQLALARTDQREVAQRGVSSIVRVERAPPGAEADLERYPPGFVVGWPQQHLDPVGKIELFDLEQTGRLGRDRLLRSADRGQPGKVDRPGIDPRAAVGNDPAGQREAKRRRGGLARHRRDVNPAGHGALEQPAGVRLDIGRSEHQARAREDIEHGFGRGDGLANIERGDHVIGQLRARQKPPLFDRAFKSDTEFLGLAVDLGLGRRLGNRIGDHRAGIGQRGLPVGPKRRDRDVSHIGRAHGLFLADLRREIAPPGACACFEPAIDDRLRQRIDHDPLVVGHRVMHRPPRAQHAIDQLARQIGFDDDPGRSDRGQSCGALGCHRIAERRLGRPRTHALPVAEILGDVGLQLRRIDIANRDDHAVFRAIPALVIGPHRALVRREQRRLGPDHRARAELLPGKQRGLLLIHHALGGAAAFALFREHDRHFGADIRLRQGRRDHHAREELEAGIDRTCIGIGQVELERRAERPGLRIGIAAEARAKALPHRDRLPFIKVLRLAEHQMLEQVRKTHFAWCFVHRADIHADPDRDLIRRHAVLAHRIAHPVGQFAEDPFLVLRNVAAAIEPGSLRVVGSKHRSGRSALLRRSSRRVERGREQHDEGGDNKGEQAQGAGFELHRGQTIGSGQVTDQ